ncbi:MAG: hypothetical protein NDJ24_00790 [Alphaproteobacteria bacterium]|nr:hypothetical protein [Alphaproteobacteria bacterium]
MSDPDKQGLDMQAAAVTAPPMTAGFASAAAPAEPEESETKQEARKSLMRQLSEHCASMLASMRGGTTRRFHAQGDADFDNPYKKLWFSQGLGPRGCGVADCGNCITLAGTVKRPVTDAQIAVMVKAALERKDPPWETIYMFNHKGKPDLVMAQRVQNVINQMGVGHRISACVDPTKYPASEKDFDKMLRDMFRRASNGEGESQRPGFTAARNQRPGFTAAPA